MPHHQKRKQTLEAQRWDHAQINASDDVSMVAQERPPTLQGSLRCGIWSLSGHSELWQAVRPADLWVHGVIPLISFLVLGVWA